jgi:hypothetical protein
MMRTPDGHGRLELSRFLTPPTVADHRNAPVNARGYLRVMFAVDDIDETLERLRKRGAQLVGEVVQVIGAGEHPISAPTDCMSRRGPNMAFRIEAREAADAVRFVFDILHDLRSSGLGASVNLIRVLTVPLTPRVCAPPCSDGNFMWPLGAFSFTEPSMIVPPPSVNSACIMVLPGPVCTACFSNPKARHSHTMASGALRIMHPGDNSAAGSCLVRHAHSIAANLANVL